MQVSVIICSIRRADMIAGLLNCLHAQTWRNTEVLVVGSSTQQEIDEPAADGRLRVRFMPAPKGLAPARNVGLTRAAGDVVIFLDDDVRLPADFIEKAVRLLNASENADIGGLTGYDTRNYSGNAMGMRWRFRALLGITPSTHPGDASRLGRSVPLTFFEPFSGIRDIKWLPGFCQIFRRAAVEGLQYDEQIIVEDRDFSMRVGERWRLGIQGDLHLEHLRDGEARYPSHVQTWRASFGLGRSFAKRRESIRDWFEIVHVLLGEILIDLFVVVAKPSLMNLKVPLWRVHAFVSGFASWRTQP
jgi:glycosyltransferase involved in cell wall biosynthesis